MASVISVCQTGQRVRPSGVNISSQESNPATPPLRHPGNLRSASVCFFCAEPVLEMFISALHATQTLRTHHVLAQSICPVRDQRPPGDPVA
jgi:hypothetical protein